MIKDLVIGFLLAFVLMGCAFFCFLAKSRYHP